MAPTDFLKQPIRIGSWTHHWREPALYRIRLRGDLAWRLVMLLAAWAIATGAMLVVLAFNANATSIPLAIGLGAVFGLGPAWLLLFYRRQHVSGSVWLYDDHLLMQHQYAGFPLLVASSTEWSYAEISRCTVVDSQRSGYGFHVLLPVVEGRREIVGIPQSVDLRVLAAFLQQRRVTLTEAPQVPEQFCSALHPAMALSGGAAGAAVLLIGLVTYVAAGIFRGGDEQQVARGGPADNVPAAARPMVPEAPRDAMFADLPALPANPVLPFDPADPANAAASPEEAAGDGAGTNIDAESELEMVGGTGGFHRRLVDPQQRHVIGVRHRLGNWGGKPAVSMLEPLYDAGGEEQADAILAKQGYALGGLEAHVDGQLAAIRLLFMKLNEDGSLDPADNYASEWIGTPAASRPQSIASDGRPVIGLHLRSGAIVDAVGLVLRDR